MEHRFIALAACLCSAGTSIAMASDDSSGFCTSGGDCTASETPMVETEVEHGEETAGELMRMELLQGGLRSHAVGASGSLLLPMPRPGTKSSRTCAPTPEWKPTKLGKMCPDDGIHRCLYSYTPTGFWGGNVPYFSVEDAWKACCETEGCGELMFVKGGRAWFLRRASDPECKNGECEAMGLVIKPELPAVPPKPAPCDPFGPVDFGMSQVTANNLGGMGPNSQDPLMIRYTGAVKGMCDLIITTTGPYTPQNAARNGLRRGGKYAQINVMAGTAVKIRIDLVEAGKDMKDPCQAVGDTGDTFLSILDLDMAPGGAGRETVVASGYDEVLMTTPTEVHVSGSEYSASVAGTFHDNPTDPLTLTQKQAGRSITFKYSGGTSFTFELKVEAGASGRHFFIGGGSNLACP